MSSALTAGSLLAERGVTRELGAHVVGACFDRSGSQVAFGLGDGWVHLAPRAAAGDWISAELHDGAVLSLCPDTLVTGFVSAGDDGMLQRVGLAQALVNDPELLILDEPTSALDPLARVMVRELLVAARNAGKTIFLSSHLLSEVELICDRVAMLHRGKLARLDTTANLLRAGEQTEIVARAIGLKDFDNAVTHNGVVSFCVPAQNQRSALEKVWNLGGEVVSVNQVRRSLEEIFLEVTAEPKAVTSKGIQ